MSASAAAAAVLLQPTFAPLAAFVEIPPEQADRLLSQWGHYLGRFNRPFGRQDFGLLVEGCVVAVASSGSAVSATVAGYRRSEVVELARLCRAPDAPWATRTCLRLWRELGGPAWPYWQVKAAVAYSANDRHEGRIYRFDGWEKVTEKAGSSGGGAWSRPRYAGDAAHGRKTLWLWRYETGGGG